jgi:hypothetical protein
MGELAEWLGVGLEEPEELEELEELLEHEEGAG